MRGKPAQRTLEQVTPKGQVGISEPQSCSCAVQAAAEFLRWCKQIL